MGVLAELSQHTESADAVVTRACGVAGGKLVCPPGLLKLDCRSTEITDSDGDLY